MILAGAKNPGNLFEDTAGAGWVRVERGVRHAIKLEASELAMRLVSRMAVCAREIMSPRPKEEFRCCCAKTEKSDSRSMIVVVGVMGGKDSNAILE